MACATFAPGAERVRGPECVEYFDTSGGNPPIWRPTINPDAARWHLRCGL